MKNHHDRRSQRWRSMNRRPRSVAFVAWGAVAGRSAEIAESLGGRAYTLFPPSDRRRPNVFMRYIIGSVLTILYLAREDPTAVIVTNPPAVLALIGLGWTKLRGVPFALDSHPGAFGRQGDNISARLLRLHRFVARHATVTLVTADQWADMVQTWGGRGLVVHEAPGFWECVRKHPRSAGVRIRALLVARFAGDEPVEAAVGAAALVPEIDLLVTGRLEDSPPGLVASAPPNVSFVGFLAAAEYQNLVSEVDIVVALTSEPTSVMRAAYEAVYACKPLVISNWPLCRELFPSAVAVANNASAIATGLRSAAGDIEGLEQLSLSARAVQIDRWMSQLSALRAALGLP